MSNGFITLYERETSSLNSAGARIRKLPPGHSGLYRLPFLAGKNAVDHRTR